MLKKSTNAAILCMFVLLNCLAANAGAPEWLRNLAHAPAKSYPDDVNAVALLDDGETIINEKGDIVVHERVAYRILRPEGRSFATLGLNFDNETKITSMHGWSITAKGQEYEAKEKDAFERSLSTYEIYSDDREKVLQVSGADVGTVVGFEYEQKRRPYIFQDNWYFQEMIPVEHSRYSLRLPKGWEYRAAWVNHAEQAPVEQNGAYVWELTDVPRIERDYNRPPYRALASHMVVTFISEKFKDKTYQSWSDLASWNAQVIAGSFDSSPALQQKVQELAPASLPIMERIRALARFAQHDVRYAAIEIGIGGWRPHPASEVFTHRYGDCKDKATLLKSMLSQIGVKSYYMPVHTDRGIVTAKTPPDLSFNHVILAIQLPAASTGQPLPALLEHPRLGRLLIFDPTSESVPFGRLPWYEQDSYALLLTDNSGELVHLPISNPQVNKISRTGKLNLQPDGSLRGEVEETLSGYFASDARDVKDYSLQDRKKVIEHLLGNSVGSFQVESFDILNADNPDKDMVLRYKFVVDHYAKTAGSLLLVRPRVLGEMADYFDPAKPRHYGYQFKAPFSETDLFEISLPDGFKVDELPDPATGKFPFATYESKSEAAGNMLRYRRDYTVDTTLVPLDQIGDLKKLFGEINLDEKNMAILKKAN